MAATRTPAERGTTGELVLLVGVAFVSAFAAAAQTFIVAVVLGAAAGVAAIVMSLRSIRWAWCVYFAAVCANGALVTVGTVTIRPEYGAAPVFLAALVLHTRRRVTSESMGPTLVAVGIGGVLVVAAIAATVFAPDAAASLRMLVQLAVALLVVLPLMTADLDLTFVVRSGTVILASICIVSIVLFVLDPVDRVRGLAFEPNVMGALCVGWLGVLHYFAPRTDIVGPRIVAAAVPIVVALILTSTRAAWLALAVVFLFWAVRNVTRRPILVATAVIAAVGSAAYLQDIYVRVGDEDTFLWRLVHVVDLETGTGAYRVQIWDSAVQQILGRDWGVLIGTGLNSFPQFNPVDPTNVSAAYLSSMWLALVYDVGVVGCAFALVLLVGLFVAVPDKLRALPLFVALAICTSVTSIVWFAFPWTFLALVTHAPADRSPMAVRRIGVSRGAHRRRVPVSAR